MLFIKYVYNVNIYIHVFINSYRTKNIYCYIQNEYMKGKYNMNNMCVSLTLLSINLHADIIYHYFFACFNFLSLAPVNKGIDEVKMHSLSCSQHRLIWINDLCVIIPLNLVFSTTIHNIFNCFLHGIFVCVHECLCACVCCWNYWMKGERNDILILDKFR